MIYPNVKQEKIEYYKKNNIQKCINWCIKYKVSYNKIMSTSSNIFQQYISVINYILIIQNIIKKKYYTILMSVHSKLSQEIEDLSMTEHASMCIKYMNNLPIRTMVKLPDDAVSVITTNSKTFITTN